MINYDEGKKLFHIKTKGMSYVFCLTDYLHNLYWGPAISADDYAGLLAEGAHSSFDSDVGSERDEYPSFNSRSFSEPCLKASDNSGKMLFMKYSGYEIDSSCPDVDTLRIFLKDASGLSLTLIYEVYSDYDIIARSTRLENRGDSLHIDSFQSAALCLPKGDRYSLRYVTGKWAGEWQINDSPIQTGVFAIQSKRGITGPHFNPSFAISEEGAGEFEGNVWFGLLGYSGNWKISFEKTIFGNVRVTGGMNDYDFSLKLETGASAQTPKFYFGFSPYGYGGMSRCSHRFQRKYITSTPKPRRVLYNSWEATVFNVNIEGQTKLAETAARMGVELFVVDDGWFGERNSDRVGLGDWKPNQNKFPNGLGELISRVNDLGMDFGIWVEPEAVNPDSDLYRAHPDWIYHIDDVTPMQARNQYVLNISRPEVKQYLKDMLYGLLSENNISYVKWDMNRALTDVDGSPDMDRRSLWRGHVEALYELWGFLKQEFPKIELETCAGGGGRVDCGILRFADQCWPSDNTDPYDRQFIHEGFTQFYPPKIMMSWVTDTHEGQNKDGRNRLEYKFHSAMCGGLGIGADISKFSEKQISECSKMVEIYKQIRSVIQFGDLYRLSSPRGSEFSAVEYISEDAKDIVVFAFLHSQRFGNRYPRLKLRGLSSDAEYFDAAGGKRCKGSFLMNAGVPVELYGDFSSVMLRLRKIDE